MWSLGALGAAWAVRARPEAAWGWLALGAGLRLLTLLSPASLSDDVYRYLWEGEVIAAGLNPFLYAPNDPALAHLRDEVWAQVNHKDVSTIYPPGALWLFRAMVAVTTSPLGWKVLSGACDLGVAAALWRMCPARGVGAWAPVAYALHPLPILETAGSGHLEGPAALAMTLSFMTAQRPGLSALWAWAGASVKLLPGLALLGLARAPSRGLAWGAVLGGLSFLALGLPFLDAGATLGRGFGRYYEAWAFNGLAFSFLEAAVGDGRRARWLGVALGGLYCAAILRQRPSPDRLMLHVSGALLVLSPVVHPWYALWALAPAMLRGVWPWLVFVSLCPLSYLALADYDARGWQEVWWVPWIEHPALWLSLLLWWARSRTPSPG
ncbi:hypothetical protein L6R49_06265 [Myxococcota bacterium]|nr:hypothetical protein [Myxococcota bacterium]